MPTDLFTQHTPATLALADGSIFSGYGIGSEGITVGEMIFNTSMTGYQEILTDPSYAEQIITFTYPHIGNVGVNSEDEESQRIWAKGLVIRELSPIVSNWRAEQSLNDYLKARNVIGIAGIDTRRLTRLLREKGAQAGCIMTGTDAETAIHHAKTYSGLSNTDLTGMVSRHEIQKIGNGKRKIVVYDFGVKQNILNSLIERNCELIIVPASTCARDVIALKPSAVVLSNGPGDPAACINIIQEIRALFEANLPILGICLGCQLLALAFGAKTFKMKFGHRGANHPVKNILTGEVFITSQNHGFAVDINTLPSDLIMTHQSLFDGTLQGLRHQHKPIFGFQGHPEASPGPHDMMKVFDEYK